MPRQRRHFTPEQKVALRRTRRTEAAIDRLSVAQRLTPDDPQTNCELGLACAAGGRREDAVRFLRRAVELSPDNAEFRAHLAALTDRPRDEH